MARYAWNLWLFGLIIAISTAFGSIANGNDKATAKNILSATATQGGLIVHLGCGDGALTAALRANESYIVQGLDTSAERVAAARKRFVEAGLVGDVTARTYDGENLPLIDNLVNLIVVSDPARVSDDELIRVLAPNGVAYVQQGDAWKKTVKPWPNAIDEWTHYLHNPQGTMVGGDTIVGPPRRIQWVGGPKWMRNHDFMCSMSAMVSAGGRIFYIIDEGLRNHIFLPAKWTLIARDGFNGKILWKKPMETWHPSNWPLKSGPGHMPRRLVAVRDRVFVTEGLNEPLTALDAATGKTIKTYEGTKSTEEIIFDNGVLYLVVDPNREPVGYRAKSTGYGEIGHASKGWAWSDAKPPRTVMAINADSGKVLWKHEAKVAPLTLTLGGGSIFFGNATGIVALDPKTGKQRWVSEGPGIKSVPTGGSVRVVFSNDIVVVAIGTNTTGLSAKTGEQLWTGRMHPSSHHCPNDVFVIDGLVWSANTGVPQHNGTDLKALDLRTGEVSKDFVAKNLPGFPMHPRCYPSKATTRYIMTNGMGTEFFELGGTTVDINNHVRGACIYGIMPSNGLLYKPPDSCACYYQSKLEWLCALAPAADPKAKSPKVANRLQKGPAFGKITQADHPTTMYRADSKRSGSNPNAVSPKLKEAWSVQLGGKLTQPVVASGKMFVAAVDQHSLHALDAKSGKSTWQFTAGGRIDSSPTIHRGAVIFGCADGWVYCLRADDGQLAWRYLVAPDERQHVSYQQLESVWPVSGSVLLYDDVLYCLAGRNMFLDGGLRLVRLDAATGKELSETLLDENDPRTGKNLQTLISKKYMPVANADLFSCDGNFLYMQAQKFDLEGKRLGISPGERKGDVPPDKSGKHLFCQTGFLDDLWFHRSYWIYGEDCGEGWGAYASPRRGNPCGRIVVFDEDRVYAFRADPLGNMLHPRTTYKLYASNKTPVAAPPQPKGKGKQKGRPKKPRGPSVAWQVKDLPLLVNGMTLAGENLFVAGPPDVADETVMLGYLPGADDDINRQLQEQNAAWQGKKGGLLRVVAANDGAKLAEYQLDSFPVFDGMSSGEGRLFLSMKDGSVRCFEGQ